jgi:hypothetical protein
MTTTNHAVFSIYRGLALIDQDREAEQAGRSVELYLDTVDVRIGLAGFYGYVERTGSEVHLATNRFEQPRALVNCLQASGWLGACFLLPPHQAEFRRSVEDGRAFPNGGGEWREEQIKEFFSLLGFSSENRQSIHFLNGEELYDFVREQAETAEKAFKAVQSILYRPEERFRIWRQKNLLQLCPHRFDYIRLTRSERFKKLLDAFSEIRPGRSHENNNFADAVSLAMLMQLCSVANGNEKAPLPRFFDSSGLFGRVAARSGTESELLIRVADAWNPVLVDADSLIYAATFHGPDAARPSYKSSAVDPEKLFQQLKRIVGGSAGESDGSGMVLSKLDKVDLNALDHLEIDGRPLREVVNELANLSFLNNIWLEQIAKRELTDLAERFKAEFNTDEVRSRKFRSGLKRVIQKAKNFLQEKANDYELLNSIWHELRDGVLLLRSRFGESPRRPFDVIRDLELLRFGLPTTVKAAIQRIMSRLLDEKIESNQVISLDQWSQLVDDYFEARQEPREHLHEAQVAAAALWAMERYRSIVELLDSIAGQGGPVSIDIIYAAACFRGRLKDRGGEQVLADLGKKAKPLGQALEYEDRNHLMEEAELAIGTGYLYFHLWHSRNYIVEWREGAGENSKLPMDEEGNRLLLAAAESARRAVKILVRLEQIVGRVNEEVEQKKVYALNQKLYYLTELGLSDAGSLNEMDNAATELSAYKDAAPELWWPTFHDTLARYHHLLALRAKNLETAYQQIKEAVRQSEQALAAQPWKPLYDYRSSVLIAKTRIEERLSSSEGETA